MLTPRPASGRFHDLCVARGFRRRPSSARYPNGDTIMTVRRILVPVDYSSCSEGALRYAGFVAQRLGAAIDVVHAWDRPSYVPDTLVVGRPGEPERTLGELIQMNADREMTEFLARVTLPEGVKAEHCLVSGEPASAILDRVRADGYELIVIGTHGRTGVRHLLLGSVAEKVIRLSPVPVLTVPLCST